MSRELRGLSILLLFAAYEHLLTSLCRTLLEFVAKSRATARRMKPGLRLFLAYEAFQGLAGSSKDKLWRRHGPKVVQALNESRARDLNTDLFPHDGSFMKASQVRLFCELFDLGDPGTVLKEVWLQLDTIVDLRNGIAHGRLTPDEVGRNYTYDEVLELINLWESRWIEFIDWVEACCDDHSMFTVVGR
ncbi:HEPN domain-containing protein [Micromonospora rubida]